MVVTKQGFKSIRICPDLRLCTAREIVYEKRNRQETIICPILAACYNNYDLQADDDGRVTFEDLQACFVRIGMEPDYAASLLTKIMGDAREFNLFDMRNKEKYPFIGHAKYTGVRHGGVDETRFKEMMRFGSAHDAERNQQGCKCIVNTLTLKRRKKKKNASAENRFYSGNCSEICQTFSLKNEEGGGKLAQMLTFAAMLAAFGRLDASFNPPRRYLTQPDLHRLMVDGRYPEEWIPKVFGRKEVAGMLWAILTDGSILAEKRTMMLCLVVICMMTFFYLSNTDDVAEASSLLSDTITSLP
jgi:hypothetical protein